MRAQPFDPLGVKLIEATGAGAMVCYQARLFEDLEVLRDGRPGDRQVLSDLIDSERPGGQLLKDGHPRRVGEGIEASL